MKILENDKIITDKETTSKIQTLSRMLGSYGGSGYNAMSLILLTDILEELKKINLSKEVEVSTVNKFDKDKINELKLEELKVVAKSLGIENEELKLKKDFIDAILKV